MTPMGAVVRGIAAGTAGVAAMDGFSYVRYRLAGGRSRPLSYEFGTERDWEKVSAPGKVGKRLIEGFTQQELPVDKAPLVNNAMHWGYGLGWGVAYGIMAGSLRNPRPLLGPVFGAAVWLAGYAFLPLAKVYQPIWEYDTKTLVQDLSGHLVYGAGVGIVFRLLANNGGRCRTG